MDFGNLKIIGTSHIARQSLKEVGDAIEIGKPGIVALELDRKRLYGLFEKERKIGFYAIKSIGIKGFLFSLLGAWAEKKLGEVVGVAPGSEMKKAVRLARKNKIKIALIDQDIEVTLKKFSERLTWKERWNFLADIVKSVFSRDKSIEFDLATVPSDEIIKKLVAKVKERYPNVYDVLIEERNQIMAKNLRKLMEENPDTKIVAIVGAGHEEEILKLIKGEKISYSFNHNVQLD